MQLATLVFLLNDRQILLAMKKRGHGKGFWNGVGGKPEPGEAIDKTAARECQEEIGVTPLELKQAGLFDFHFPADMEKASWSMKVHTFTCSQWEGEPIETEEMAPRWFDLDKIPYESMWSDDIIWLPEVLSGKYVNASFSFDKKGNVIQHEMQSTTIKS